MLARIYYDKTEPIAADIIHNYGNAVLASTIGYHKTVMVQISGSVGCDFKYHDYIGGFGKYLGNKTAMVNGVQQSVPSYQLLWCDNGEDTYELDTVPVPVSLNDQMSDPKFAKDIKNILQNVADFQTSGKTEGGIQVSANDIEIGGGSRSKAEIMDVVNRSVVRLKSVYNRYLKNKPGFSGKVTLKFIIAASGNITDIDIVSSTTNYPEFDNAIKEKVAQWNDWKTINSGNATATIQFSFTK